MINVRPSRRALSLVLAASAGALSLSACAADTDTSAAPGTASETPAVPGAVAPTAESPTAASPGVSPAASTPAAPTRTLLGTVAMGTGGTGGPAAGAATSVKLSTLLAGGVQAVLGVVPVAVDGSFAADVAADTQLVILDALGPTGQVVGSAVVAVDVAAKGSIKVGPITPHSSLIVDVLRKIFGCYEGHGETLDPTEPPSSGVAPLAVDVSLHLDAEVDAAVKAAIASGLSADLLVDALAKGILAAHKARLETLLAAGVTVDVGAMVAADLDALVKAQGGHDLKVALDDCLTAAGAVSGDLRVRADAAATLALKGALDAALGGTLGAGKLIDAALLTSIEAEANAAAGAVVDLLTTGGAPAATVDAALEAGVKLVADVGNAVSLSAAVDARKDFVATLSGSGLDLGLLTGLGVAFELATDLCIGTGLGFGAELDAALSADVALSGKVDVCAGTLELGVGVDVHKQLSFEAVIGSLLGVCGGHTGGGESLDEPAVSPTSGLDASLLAKVLASAQLVARVQI